MIQRGEPVPNSDPCHLEVQLLLVRDGRALRLRCYEPGRPEGCLRLVTGRVSGEHGAEVVAARELRDKTGIAVEPAQMHLWHVARVRGPAPRIALFFRVEDWSGEPANAQPFNVMSLDWVPMARLADGLSGHAREAVAAALQGRLYSEPGVVTLGAAPAAA